MDGQDAKAVGSERTLKLENVCCSTGTNLPYFCLETYMDGR